MIKIELLYLNSYTGLKYISILCYFNMFNKTESKTINLMSFKCQDLCYNRYLIRKFFMLYFLK